MSKTIVLDANILFRAVLGNKVPTFLANYQNDVRYFTPSYCYVELEKYLPKIAENNNLPLEQILNTVEKLKQVVIPLQDEIYQHVEAEARNRIESRDENDWPIVALAMALNCPIWTEDKDFFGTGLPIWNSRNVEISFKA